MSPFCVIENEIYLFPLGKLPNVNSPVFPMETGNFQKSHYPCHKILTIFSYFLGVSKQEMTVATYWQKSCYTMLLFNIIAQKHDFPPVIMDGSLSMRILPLNVYWDASSFQTWNTTHIYIRWWKSHRFFVTLQNVHDSSQAFVYKSQITPKMNHCCHISIGVFQSSVSSLDRVKKCFTCPRGGWYVFQLAVLFSLEATLKAFPDEIYSLVISVESFTANIHHATPTGLNNFIPSVYCWTFTLLHKFCVEASQNTAILTSLSRESIVFYPPYRNNLQSLFPNVTFISHALLFNPLTWVAVLDVLLRLLVNILKAHFQRFLL